MFKQVFALVLLMLILVPVFAQDENVTQPLQPTGDVSRDLQALRSQIDVLIRQNADFRENLNNRLMTMPDKNYVETNIQLMGEDVKEMAEITFGTTAVIIIASVLCGSVLTLIGIFMFKGKGLL